MILALSCDPITELGDLNYTYPNGSNYYVGDMAIISCSSDTSVFENGEREFELICIEENLEPRWNGSHNFSICYGTCIKAYS